MARKPREHRLLLNSEWVLQLGIEVVVLGTRVHLGRFLFVGEPVRMVIGVFVIGFDQRSSEGKGCPIYDCCWVKLVLSI